MKTDKELLQLAAKAVGVDGVYDSRMNFVGTDYEKVTAIHNDDGGWWNPLTDDGDAFRLAVDLDMDVCLRSKDKDVTAWVECASEGVIGAGEDFGNDKHAATRRAIVRAAAAIGEAM